MIWCIRIPSVDKCVQITSDIEIRITRITRINIRVIRTFIRVILTFIRVIQVILVILISISEVIRTILVIQIIRVYTYPLICLMRHVS